MLSDIDFYVLVLFVVEIVFFLFVLWFGGI